MRGDDCWTDHNFIRSNMLLQIVPRHRKSATKSVKRLNARDDPTVQLADAATDALSAQDSINTTSIDVESEWTSLRDGVYETALHTVDMSKRRNQDSGVETKSTLRGRGEARKAETRSPNG